MIEYRVRPITRFVVTRYETRDEPDGLAYGSASERGQYDNAQVAHEVAYALCKAEHDAAGTAPDDPGFKYPNRDDIQAAARDLRQGPQLGGQSAKTQLQDGYATKQTAFQSQL